MKLFGYIEGTQTGFAYGLRDSDGTRYIEEYARVEPGWSDIRRKIGRAYSRATASLSRLEYTYRNRPDLLKLSPMEGQL